MDIVIATMGSIEADAAAGVDVDEPARLVAHDLLARMLERADARGADHHDAVRSSFKVFAEALLRQDADLYEQLSLDLYCAKQFTDGERHRAESEADS